MIDELLTNPLLWLTLTIGSYLLGSRLQKRWPIILFNPLLFSIGLLIAVLSVLNIPYETYESGGKLISFFITPATVALAVKLEKNFVYFKKYYRAILTGIFSGVLVHSLLLFILGLFFKLDAVLIASLFPKSITTAMAISVSDSLGGIISLTVAFVVFTGIMGSVIGPTLFRILKVNDPVAQGVALGSSAHAVGTSAAIKLGEVQGAMAGVSIIVTGIVVVLFAPLAHKLMQLLFI